MKKTLGGDRLGSGKKMQVDLHNYGRSNHNLSREWRSTMTQGTLVPFLVEPILMGDTFDIDLNTMVRTLPTVGPIFGTMKMQLDVFLCPMRLYIAELHNSKLGIGMNMANVKLPKMNLFCPNINFDGSDINQQQINASSLLAYLGYRGIGKGQTTGGSILPGIKKQALPVLMYWDIYKNYYANKQEGKGFVISQAVGEDNTSYPIRMALTDEGNPIGNYFAQSVFDYMTTPDGSSHGVQLRGTNQSTSRILVIEGHRLRQATDTKITVRTNLSTVATDTYVIDTKAGTITPAFPNNGITVTYQYSDTGDRLALNFKVLSSSTTISLHSSETVAAVDIHDDATQEEEMNIEEFDLETLDDMREELLQQPSGTNVVINDLEAGTKMPYTAIYGQTTTTPYKMKSIGVMGGLGLKTYLSDRFNNWLETEWIDGPNGIAAVSAVDTSSGSFTMDSLNLAQKIYNLLNRIAVSGGSYYDWMEAAYGESGHWQSETPMYMGGLSGEIAFSEVVSTSDSTDAQGGPQPLGSLAGRGTQIGERHGKIRVKAQEHSFVIGIVSFTPRVDYSEGNKWYTRLDTMDDWHKPAFDGIGFQELITDEMAAWDTSVDESGNPVYKSAGKQPSWIEYMTSQNECYGGFAQNDSEMFMTFSRRYQPDIQGNIEDLTTYIDPRKYNYAFAVSDLTAQNLWVQIGIKLHARRKMSAKMIPNL